MVGGLGAITLSLVGWGMYKRNRSLGEWDLWTTFFAVVE